MDRFVMRYAKVVIPFVVAAAAAFANSGCSDGGTGNAGGGSNAGTGGQGGESPATSSSSSSSSSSSGMMGCGDLQTDPMNCGVCGHECAPGQTCMAGVCTCGTTNAAFADVQTILTAKCATAGCHTGGAMAKAGLDLSSGMSHAELVSTASSQCGASRMRVSPGKPDESYLVDKVLGKDMCTALGKRMPPSAMLPMADIQLISDWICAGAPQ